MHTPARTMFVALLLTLPAAAQAGLPECSDKSVAQRARSQFNFAMEVQGATMPRRAKSFAEGTETGRTPYVHPLAPPGYELRFCEGSLKLDDSSTLPVFVRVTGKDGDGKAEAEAIETCWIDPRFPRFVTGCKEETAPGRR